MSLLTLQAVFIHSNEVHLAIKIISYIIVIFPSIDVCTVFPLVVLVIVNNIYTVVFGRDSSEDSRLTSFFIRLVMKFMVALMAIVVAIGVSNLIVILTYSGLISFLTSLIIPCFLQLRSQWVCRKMFGKASEKQPSHELHEVNGKTAVGGSGDSVPLLPQDSRHSPTPPCCSEKGNYTTPYSSFLTHPVVVVFVGIIMIVCFFLSVVSLFVPPKHE